MEGRKSFIFYRSFLEAAEALDSREDQTEFLMAVCRYALDGTEPQGLNPTTAAMFALTKPNLDTSRKRAEWGAMGGKKSQATSKLPSEATSKPASEAEAKLASGSDRERDKGEGIKDKGEGIKNNPPPTPPGEGDDGFTAFWAAWPDGHRVGKQAAIKAWSRLKPDKELTQAILTDVEYRKGTQDWLKEGGRYIPHPSTYINGRRWEDERPEAAPSYALDEKGNPWPVAGGIDWSKV